MESDPFVRLVDTLSVIENQDRILCLTAVYIGQKADKNTIQGITDILSCLLGKEDEYTTTKTRGLITSLVNGGILEREREKVISSTRVSFHSISPLGYIVLAYVLVTYVLREDPSSIAWDNAKFQDYADSEDKLVLFIINTLLVQIPSTKRILTSLQSGKEPRRIKLTKPLSFPVYKIFSGKSGYNVFKLLEEVIWDHLQFNVGLSKTELSKNFSGPIGGYLNKLSTFFMTEENWGKNKRFKLSIRGVFLLPVFALLIKSLSVDKTIFQSLIITKLDENDNLWIRFTQLGHSFFKNVFRIS
ncbi:hypothetical protein CEE45_15785 [Candidatus Heimdallarchaeota archaeon B3_Heim]|nr:MAG: hypothetical protein CEE45_15785 [Candidatus Heimdallarchaeota archaeon B3_Heim]